MELTATIGQEKTNLLDHRGACRAQYYRKEAIIDQQLQKNKNSH